jgi:hypothetical protein
MGAVGVGVATVIIVAIEVIVPTEKSEHGGHCGGDMRGIETEVGM